jgi:hypothetical protein
MTTSFVQVANRAVTTLDGAIADDDLTIAVVDSSVFPTSYPFTISINDEILEVSNNNTGTNTLTVSRGEEGTSAAAAEDGDGVAMLITARWFSDLHTAVNAVEAAPPAHKDSHDPNDGSDPLDTANAAEIAGVQAAGTGTAHTFARADHAHQVQHGVTDNHLVTVDDAGGLVNGEYPRATSNGLESRSKSEVATDLKDQFPQAITDNHVLTVDDASAADNDFGVFTASGLEGVPAQTALSLLLAQTMVENDALKLDSALSADGKYNGITRAGTAGATLAFGDLCYLAVADSRWELTDADAAATTQGLLGICVQAAAANGSATTMLLVGIVRADTAFPTLTIGAPVFVSTTAGDITTTAPSGAADCIRCIGQGWTADELWFCPSSDWFEHA